LFSAFKTTGKAYKFNCVFNPVEWPKTGLEVQDAVNLVEEGVHEGHVPMLSDSIFCLRHAQSLGYPMRVIAVKNPVFPIGLVESRSVPEWLGNVSWITLRRVAFDCIFTANLYDDLPEGLEELRRLKATLVGRLGKVRHAEAPVQIVDRESAVEVIPSSATEDTAVAAVDSLNCLWEFRNGLRRIFIVERPLLLIAITSLSVNRELEERGQPTFAMVDETDGGRCLWGGFIGPEGSADDYRAAFRRFLSGLLKVVSTVDVPLELVIMETDSIINRIVNKGNTG
jgi:hypothetical protein